MKVYVSILESEILRKSVGKQTTLASNVCNPRMQSDEEVTQLTMWTSKDVVRSLPEPHECLSLLISIHCLVVPAAFRLFSRLSQLWVVCCFSFPSCEGWARTKTSCQMGWDRWLRYRDKFHKLRRRRYWVNPNQKKSPPNLFLLLGFFWFPNDGWLQEACGDGYMAEAEMRTIVRKGTHSIDLVLHWYDIWNIIKGLLR